MTARVHNPMSCREAGRLGGLASFGSDRKRASIAGRKGNRAQDHRANSLKRWAVWREKQRDASLCK